MNKQPGRKHSGPGPYTSIRWCYRCNLPLIGERCAICNEKGREIALGPPGDVRFCSPADRSKLHDILISVYGTDPLGNRVILLNKIGGEDRTDQVIVDGMVFGILRYDLAQLEWKLDLQVEGAGILAEHTQKRTVELSDATGHLSGKTVVTDRIYSCSGDVRGGDDVIIRYKTMVGVGTALLDADLMKQPGVQAVRIRKIGRAGPGLNDHIPSMEDVIKANIHTIKMLGKDAINTIRGIANQHEFKGTSIYVSFSGGKDSLAVLDLTRSALKHGFGAYFINTGLEFPQTVEYVRGFCSDNGIPLIELDAKDAFWHNLHDFGPPAKDYRWCCKVCKLSPAGEISSGRKYLTLDGKRRYESFSRARIPPKEENPLVPGQINVYPVRDWKAIEVWLYIMWRGLRYNPLYDKGLERIGCWLCPAAHAAEYRLMEALYPDLYSRWEGYLKEWAEDKDLPEGYIRHGFWRWRTHPPKMKLLSEQLGVPMVPKHPETGSFQITVVSGISPCSAGGYSLEGTFRGITPLDTLGTMRTIGDVSYSDNLGVLLVRAPRGSIKLYADGSIQIHSQNMDSADDLFQSSLEQLTRSAKCTGCGICEKACPREAITIKDDLIHVDERCDRCGKCTEVCVAVRYLDKMFSVKNYYKRSSTT